MGWSRLRCLPRGVTHTITVTDRDATAQRHPPVPKRQSQRGHGNQDEAGSHIYEGHYIGDSVLLASDLHCSKSNFRIHSLSIGPVPSHRL